MQDEINKRPLLDFGHVAISFDGGKTLFGLTPDRPKTATHPDGVPLEDMLASLRRHEVFAGHVGEDTPVFEIARRMADERGWNTAPVRVTELFTPAEQQRLAARVAELVGMAPGEHGIGYSLPLKTPENGQYFRGGIVDGREYAACNTANCARWPALLGVAIPEESGNMRDYMPKLSTWAAADAPIDARAKEDGE